ncbi:MAG: substrate-binding domain-containing protein [Kiritimatiellae bacterium]|nr:substrate-binding domain-containing protein [Kiritimatiellia bacterium]
MSAHSAPKVLVVFSNIDVSHRKMLSGILHYAREKCTPPWEVQLDLHDLGRRSSTEVRAGGFSGIIAAVINPADRRKYFRTGLPTVLFEPTLSRMDRTKRPANNITFFNDHAAEGRAAAEYFIARGYKSFAYVGTAAPLAWSDARRRGYAATLRLHGIKPSVFRSDCTDRPNDFIGESRALKLWLRRLPAKTAVFAAHDERARQVAIAARRAGVRIPDDIALLGVDDDELLCTTSAPPISSIHVPSEEEGWRFAQAMSALLAGRNPTPVCRTCHTRVITRLSTDSFALSDPIVTKAVSYAEKHLSEPLRGERLARAANCSLRTLQLKVLKTLGRTVKEEIAFLRQSTAQKLLRETSMPVAEIASACGFCSSSHLATHIRRATGLNPLSLRKSARGLKRIADVRKTDLA